MEWAEKLFMQCSGQIRDDLDKRWRFYQYQLLNTQDLYQKMRLRNYFRKYLLVIQVSMNQYRDNDDLSNDSWMDEEDKIVENLFDDWDGEA